MNTLTLNFVVNEVETTMTLDQLIQVVENEVKASVPVKDQTKYTWPRDIQRLVSSEMAVRAENGNKAGKVRVERAEKAPVVSKKARPDDEGDDDSPLVRKARKSSKKTSPPPALEYAWPSDTETTLSVAFKDAETIREQKVTVATAIEAVDVVEKALGSLPGAFYVRLDARKAAIEAEKIAAEEARKLIERGKEERKYAGGIFDACVSLYRVVSARMNVYTGATNSTRFHEMKMELQDLFPGRAYEDELRTQLDTIYQAVREVVDNLHAEKMEAAIEAVEASAAAYSNAGFVLGNKVANLFLEVKGREAGSSQNGKAHTESYKLSVMLTKPTNLPVEEFFLKNKLFLVTDGK